MLRLNSNGKTYYLSNSQVLGRPPPALDLPKVQLGGQRPDCFNILRDMVHVISLPPNCLISPQLGCRFNPHTIMPSDN